MRHLNYVDVGVPVDEYSGPDLTVIVIPSSCPQLQEIQARKRFFDISVHRTERLAESLSDSECWFIVGNPRALQGELSASHGFSRIINTRGFAAYTYVTKRENTDSFDFLHLRVERSKLDSFTENFGGMSGGGVWRIPLIMRRDEETLKIQLGKEILAGVAFYQTTMRDYGCEIRCHGPESIYKRVYEALSDWESQH